MSLKYCSIKCDCERGEMFKTSLRDDKNQQVMFSLYSSEPEDLFQFSLLIFQGYCSACGKKFQYELWLEGLISSEVRT